MQRHSLTEHGCLGHLDVAPKRYSCTTQLPRLPHVYVNCILILPCLLNSDRLEPWFCINENVGLPGLLPWPVMCSYGWNIVSPQPDVQDST